jgi:DNA-binding NarL/FixJ family response regulator
MASYSVLIADDHDIVRFGISSVIDLSPELNVQAEASNGEEAVNLYKNDHPDVVVLDLSMPKVNGIQTIRQLMEYDPHAKILVLTVHLEEGTLDQAIKFGALGYVLKDCNRSELVDAVTTVASGKRYFSDSVNTVLRNRYLQSVQTEENQEHSISDQLTERELEILWRVADGNTSREIGEELAISRRTVERHRSNIIKKLNLKNGNELLKTAVTWKSNQQQ